MKIPKVEKLPSGRYRVQVQVGGQRYGETFDTPEEAQFWAARHQDPHQRCPESPPAA